MTAEDCVCLPYAAQQAQIGSSPIRWQAHKGRIRHRACPMIPCRDSAFEIRMIATAKNEDTKKKFAAIIKEQLEAPTYISLNMAMGRKDVDHEIILKNMHFFTGKSVLLESMKKNVSAFTEGQTTLFEDLLWAYCHDNVFERAFAYSMLSGDIWRYEEEVKKCIEDDKHPTPPIPYVLQVIFCPEVVTEKNDLYDKLLKPYYEFVESDKQQAEAQKKQAEERRRREETARLDMEEANRLRQEREAREAIKREVAEMEKSMDALRLSFPNGCSAESSAQPSKHGRATCRQRASWQG
jgi:hypothetical protein